MLHKFKTYYSTLNISPNKSIYLAISGGIDSMVLSNLLVTLKIPHTLLHCNFNLRGKDSELDEQFVLEYAQQNKLTCLVKQFETEDLAQQQKLTIQECARNLRYDWFRTFLTDTNSVLFTAHHLDDSIETFFINILRGTGLKGLKGITNKPNIIRPLLQYSKSEITNYANKTKISFREDISNGSDKYLRNNLRHHTIPKLKELDNQLLNKMGTLFTELQEIDFYLDSQIVELKSQLEENQTILINEIINLPVFLITRLFNGYGIKRKNSNELINVIKGKSGSVFITESHRFLNNRGQLIIEEKEKNQSVLLSFNVTDNLNVQINQHVYLKLTLLSAGNNLTYDSNTAFIDLNKIKQPLTIRNWKQGDRMIPFGMRGTKLISDLLINKKVNLFNKEKTLVLENENEIVWLVNHTISEKFKINADTTNILKIEFLKY
jgi:tRNA(Ile)-lysidine synthase